MSLRSPWPEVFADTPGLRFVMYNERLRTQAKNLRRHARAMLWHRPVHARQIKVYYGLSNPYEGIIPDMATVFGVPFRPDLFTLPPAGKCPVKTGKPIAVIRPVTVRNEWANPARNCRVEYISQAAAILRERFHVVSVADVVEHGEWFDGNPPTADEHYHRGELRIANLMSLIQHASVVVGSVGWIAPMSVAAKRPLILIAGGQGAWNAPDVIFHRSLDTSQVRWLLPDNYCRCAPANHDCDKTISDFNERFRTALQDITYDH